jgi:hypothetical protein
VAAGTWLAIVVLTLSILAGVVWVASGLWRIFRGKEQMVSGGSLGRQLFARSEAKRLDQRDH